MCNRNTWCVDGFIGSGYRRSKGRGKLCSLDCFFCCTRPNHIPQELATGFSPATCQIDQVLAGIVCCWVSAPVHSTKCWDPSKSWSVVWTWPAICSSDRPRLAWMKAACIVHSLLSLSGVPLECKPPVSQQRNIPELHAFFSESSTVVLCQVTTCRWFNRIMESNGT